MPPRRAPALPDTSSKLQYLADRLKGISRSLNRTDDEVHVFKNDVYELLEKYQKMCRELQEKNDKLEMKFRILTLTFAATAVISGILLWKNTPQ
jgi:chromosome segregation ATPase